jgi:hypothetical protein
MMKRLVAHVIFIALMAYPFVCFSAFMIHLKNGQSFQTDRYWEDGGEIKFHRYGGVVGIKKDLVREIEEVDLPEDKKPVEEKPPQPAEAAKKKVKPPEKEKPGKKTLDECWEEKKELTEKLNESLKQLREATRKKDKAAKQKAREELRRISKKIYALTDEVKRINGGELPEYWWRQD